MSVNNRLNHVTNCLQTKYTLEEVLKHNEKEDCWIIIDNYVYDLSKTNSYSNNDIIEANTPSFVN